MARNRNISKNKKKEMQEALDSVNRAVKSQQPRFQPSKSQVRYITSALYRLMNDAEERLPEYRADSRDRDKELLRLIRSENIISGILSSVVARDQNRAWMLTGGVRQVMQYGSKLHEVHDGAGWRQFISLNSTAYHVTNFGFISELGFVSRNGRAETMWHVDPTRVMFSGDRKEPINYYPREGGTVKLERYEYIQGNSMPAVEEQLRGIGFSAVERCLYAIRLMMGIFRHSLEKLGFSPPKGIMLGKGIRRQDLQNAWVQYNEDKERQDIEFYEGVLSIFTTNPQAALELVSLSQLPDNFSLGQWLDNLVKIMALAFNYPVAEFWSMDTGTWGRGESDALQFEQATSKGENSFALAFQEQLQKYFLPQTVDFVFDNRDDQGDKLLIDAKAQAADMIGDLYERKDANNDPLLTKEQAQRLLVDEGIIPAEFIEEQSQETTATDLKAIRERLLSENKIFRIAEKFPDEPIIQYRYSTDIGNTSLVGLNQQISKEISKYPYIPGNITVLWENGSDVFRKSIF